MPGEVADDAAYPQPRVVGGDLPRWTARSALTDTSSGTKVPSPPCRAKRVQQQPGLLRRARAQLDQRLRAGRRGDLGGVRGQDRPLRPGRVVLRQPGDLLEQLAAPGVVEPLGWQPLRRRRSARPARRRAARGRGPAHPGGSPAAPRSSVSSRTCRSKRPGRTGGPPVDGVAPVGGRHHQLAVRHRLPGGVVVERLGGHQHRVAGPARTDSACPTAVATTVAAVGEQQVQPGPGAARGDRRRPSPPPRSAGGAPPAAGAGPAPTAAPSRSARPGSAGRAPAGRRPAGPASPASRGPPRCG